MAAQRPFPRKTLEIALRVPRALKEKNGGNPWASEQVAAALGVGAKGGNFFYISSASRDYGLTTVRSGPERSRAVSEPPPPLKSAVAVGSQVRFESR